MLSCSVKNPLIYIEIVPLLLLQNPSKFFAINRRQGIWEECWQSLYSSSGKADLKALTDHFEGGSRVYSFDLYGLTGGSEIFFIFF
jgi:hypothetical protein